MYDAIGKVDDDILEKSEAAAKAGNVKRRWLIWGAAAASLVIVGVVLWRQIQPAYIGDAGMAAYEDGVTIPRAEFSLSANEAANMIGFFIYQDRCYVQYEWIDDAEGLVGEYLGTATGRIDEWTPADGYVEFAGSIGGDFYAVKGYDPAFILCMKQEDGAVCTYICNNGITLKVGAELFEDRLHLSGTIASVQYESSDSWFYGWGERYQMNSVNEVVLDFIRDLDAARFIPADAVPGGDLADTEMYHLVFQPEDGVPVHLRLYENGYVQLQQMWYLCAQVPKKSCGALLELLDSRAGAIAVERAEFAGPTWEDCRNDPELGRFVPTYAPENARLAYADIYDYLDGETSNEIATRAIWLEYKSLEPPHYFYSITITWADEYDRYAWTGPMINAADLSLDWILDSIKPETASENPPPEGSLEVGVWYDDVCVVLSAYGVDAETAYQILSSIQ